MAMVQTVLGSHVGLIGAPPKKKEPSLVVGLVDVHLG